MPSLANPHRRRPRSETEDEEEGDILRSSQRSPPSSSDSAKRARTNGYHNESQSEESDIEDSRTSYARQRRSNIQEHDDDGPVNGNEAGASEFQPGAIVRVKLSNFVTYEKAEFFPGPNLNMVIGPNGTGKSSLVCAICLGLGWGPQHLGRAGQVGEFVKHNTNVAEIEIELQKRHNEKHNHIVRVRITRDGNGREWWLDHRKTSLKAVQALTKSLSIQIDNLCQFLPQDKVSEFAALSPVELLLQTQRAAAPEQMLEWHENLKTLRKDQKSLENQHDTDKETLENLEKRQENLRTEVERLQERNEILEKVDLLKKTIPFVEYRIARDRHIEYKKRKEDAQARFKDLEAQVGPTLQSIRHKESYRDRISTVVTERKKLVQDGERAADTLRAKIESLEEDVQRIEHQVQAEFAGEATRKKSIQTLQRKIADLMAQLNSPPIEFDPVVWNERIRAKNHVIRDIDAESRDLIAQERELSERGKANRTNQDNANQELGDFDSQAGQQMHKVRDVSSETAKAWKWIQEHQGEFEQEVYGPPLISCSVKDPRYTDIIESLLTKNDFMTITAQTKSDFNKLNNELYGTMKLADVTLRTSYDSLGSYPRSLPAHEMERCGLEGWALDFIDGPEPVLAMLCDSAKIHFAGVSLRDVTEDQFNILVQSKCNTWVTGRHYYRVNSRKEYGPHATSTITRNVMPARMWTDRPVDGSRRHEIESRIEELVRTFNELKRQIVPLRERIKKLKEDRKDVTKEIDDLQQEKAALQKAKGAQSTLPGKIESEEESLAEKRREGAEVRDKLYMLYTQHDLTTLRKAKATLDHKEQVTKIRICHEELLEAEVRLIEAESDVAALNERNAGIVQRRETERQIMRDAEDESKRVKEIARNALDVCKEISAEADATGNMEYFQTISPDLTVQDLETDIASEESKLEYIHAHNPHAIRDFERRQVDVDRLKEKIAESEEKLKSIGRGITKIRAQWEPELDKLVAEISDAFSYNFEQIGCAGEVGVHKDDDFDNWAVQIKVKFRENETLQILDQHRQSGGERSVSTIFYLMALQSLARSPFRVVDEINQGMDPRNERMVHERMVEIACKEHTSQYFLITPKLLTGLRYDRRMKVLCIASGEHMPGDYKKVDVQKVLGIRRAIMAAG